jgi:hypothetical protein
MAGMLSRARSGVPSLGVGPVEVEVGVEVAGRVAVGAGVGPVLDVGVLDVGVLDVGVLVTAGPSGGAAVEQAPSRPSAARAVSALDPCMNDGNPTPRPPNELTCSPGVLNGWR